MTPEQVRQAVQAYTEKRQQMTPRKAAAHVIQEYGITASELARAVADAGQLLVQQPRQRPQGISSHRQAAA